MGTIWHYVECDKCVGGPPVKPVHWTEEHDLLETLQKASEARAVAEATIMRAETEYRRVLDKLDRPRTGVHDECSCKWCVAVDAESRRSTEMT